MPQCNESATSTFRRIKSQFLDDVFSTPPGPPQTNTPANSSNCSSATRLISSQRAASTPPERTTDLHSSGKSQTTGGGPPYGIDPSTGWSRMAVSRKRSQYYDEAFAARQSNSSCKARATKDSLIIAEVKLNCCLQSEHEFQIDMAFLLSEIYQRPAACIMILTNTDFSILLNTSTEPAYHITITALAPEIASTKNKRTAGLLRGFMLEAVNISANRGAIVFISTMEENLFTNEPSFQLDMSSEEQMAKFQFSPKTTGTAKGQKTKDTPDLPHRAATSSFWNDAVNHSRDAKSTGIDNQDKKKVRRRKSFMALFGF